MKTNTIISNMIRIISLISIVLMLSSCEPSQHRKMYKTSDGDYCFQDDNSLWFILHYNSDTQLYDVTQSNTAPDYDISTSVDVDLSSNNVSNYSEMSEATGEATGGTDSANDSDGSGMGESSGTDSGGSDSSGDGGGDGGGE